MRLATQLDSLPFLLAGASGAALKQRSPSGKWSAHENLAHLVCHHAGTIQRIERILREDRPALPSYRAETDPDWPATAALTTEEVLRRLRELRQQFVDLFAGLSDSQLARVGVHPAFGEMTVAQWIDFFLIHEAHHVYVIINRSHGRD